MQIMLGVPQQANKWDGHQLTLMEAAQQTIEAAGTKEKDQQVSYLPGSPPRGGLEREAAKLLTQLGLKDKPATTRSEQQTFSYQVSSYQRLSPSRRIIPPRAPDA